MFEFDIIKKYMAPKWRHLSISIISLISTLVIALVVWLILVFFSVTHGLEKNWIDKLTSVTAPVRVTPTQDYYNSYYYLVDSISGDSNYNLKTIGEKRWTHRTDFYDPSHDEEPPTTWAPPVFDGNGTLKDLVKETFSSIEEISGVQASDYEVTAASLNLKLLRLSGDFPTQAALTQATYIGNLEPENQQLGQILVKHTPEDIQNHFMMLGVGADQLDDETNRFAYVDKTEVQSRLSNFFQNAEVKSLTTPTRGWQIPNNLWPTSGEIRGSATVRGREAVMVVLDRVEQMTPVRITFNQEGVVIQDDKGVLSSKDAMLIAPHGVKMSAAPVLEEIETVTRPWEMPYQLDFKIQKLRFSGTAQQGKLQFTDAILAKESDQSPLWLHQQSSKKFMIPEDQNLGEGVILPKTFHEVGVLLGDRGYVSFYTPTASTVQEQRLPVYVAGFYDPGILPIGGKFILANGSLASLIRSSHETSDTNQTNGINVRFADLDRADAVKAQIEQNLKARDLDRYWKVETFREYDHARDILLQLQSDKTLLTLISLIIIVVACSNIISMLIILVNDKKQEIGILRSMGATSRNIATIFGGCGMLIGMIGSLIGMFFATLTLYRLDLLVALLSKIQGHTAFNPLFYGEQLPNQISYEAMLFVILTTTVISLLAGLIPALKACLMRPTEILKAE